MSQQNVNLIAGVYEAFEQGDVPAVLATFDPQIVWNEAEGNPYADGNPYIGPDRVLNGVFARVATEWDGFKIHREQLLDAGDTVVMCGRYSGTYKSTGVSMNPQVVHVFKLRGGKIVSFQQYVDTAQMRDAMTKRASA
jgi:ketosteroid isomerase-like protein